MTMQTITIADTGGLPPTVNLTTAAGLLGIGRTTAYALAQADAFPCRVLRVGAQYRVITADLLHLLGLDGDRPPGTADAANPHGSRR